MSDVAGTKELRTLVRAYSDLLGAQLRLGQDLVQSLTGLTLPDLGSGTDVMRRLTPKKACHIPPPCWMPQPLGDCTSHVSECKDAKLGILITNCGRTKQGVTVTVSGMPNVSVSPASLSLESLERGRVKLTFTPPDDAPTGSTYEGLVRIHGCREWYMRWTVSIGTVGMECAHEIRVDDCPDYLHHWYDHFYCPRPCGSARTPAGNG
jgi:hypothetical protein